MSIRDLLRALRRNAILVLACLVVGVGGGAYLAFTQPASYTTQTRLFVSSNGSDSTDTLLQNSNLVLERVPSYVTLVNSPLVVNKVVQRLQLTESPDAVAARIKATNPLQTALIEITVRDTSARGAYNLAVSLAETVMEVVQSIETSSTGYAPVKVTVVSRPELPGRPELAGPAWRLALGLLLGLLLGAAIAIGRELFDSRLKDPEQLRTKLGLPPLATIAVGAKPERAPPPTDDAYWVSPAGEGFRQLRTNLQVLVSAGGLRSVLVAGPHAADDAHMVARNLAIALGKAKVRVLLVEANLRRPRLAQAFGIDADLGLSAVLNGETDIDTVIHPWGAGTLQILPAGLLSAGSSELLASAAMEDLLGRLERRFDLLIVDAPPLLEVADATVLATRVDGVVLAVRHRGTTWEAVWQAVQSLHDVQARVLGAVVLYRGRRLDASPRDALRAPVASSRWAGPPAQNLATPRAESLEAPGTPARRPKRSLRSVPDPSKPLTPQSAEDARNDIHLARGVAAFHEARGVAAVGDGNRVEPHEVGEDNEEEA